MKKLSHSITRYLLILLTLLTVTAVWGNLAGRAAEGFKMIYLPLIAKDNHTGLTINGKITDAAGTPLSNVKLSLTGSLASNNASGNAPQSVQAVAVTDAQGNYQLVGLQPGDYQVTPLQDGYVFLPATRQFALPPDTLGQNFIAQTAARENILINGACESEQAWNFPITPYSAAYTAEKSHGGSRSIRTGIIKPTDNRFSYSSAQQVVSLPSNPGQATLSAWIYTVSGEATTASMPQAPEGIFREDAALGGDIQYILVLDPNTDQVLESLYWERRNTGDWEQVTFDMRKYAGMKIKLHFGSFNNGNYGVTGMYIDDIALLIGAVDPTATVTPATPVPPTATPIVSPSPTPVCSSLLDNPGFESNTDWEIPITAYSAGYTDAVSHTGARSMRTGIASGLNVYSYSDARQRVKLPQNSTQTMLTMWLRPRSSGVNTNAPEEISSADSFPLTPLGDDIHAVNLTNDLQYVLILNSNLVWVDTLVWQHSKTDEWTYYQFDLRKYVGQTFYIQFGTYNDGWGNLTSMYVDDMILSHCAQPTATPTITPTPTNTPSPTPTRTPTLTPTPSNTPTPTTTNTPLPANCQNRFSNESFEARSDWDIPVTAYSADYANELAYYGQWSMRTGITNASHNRYSYSEAGQYISIPYGVSRADLTLWQYPSSSEATNAPIPAMPSDRTWGQAALAGDVQFVLVMDTNQNIVEILYWNRTNERDWVLRSFDLKHYAGQTIKIQFGTYNDGGSGITSMYVDNAVLLTCP
jgi:hypothetical protein